jgi:hypothetical protein
MKKCTKCNEIKSLDLFNKDKNTKLGIKPHCKECQSLMSKEYSCNNKEKIKKYIENNKESIALTKKIWKENNREKVRESKRRWKSNKKAVDPIFKMKENLRRRTLKAFKAKGWQKSGGTELLLQGTYSEVFDYIESLFVNGMNWNNQGEWHIDHIIPLGSAKTKEDIIKLFNYKNLQPLWANDNILKSNKII